MARSVHLRRFVAVLLCCVLAFHAALPVAKASDPVTAATLAVTGGQLAGGALAGEAGAASLAGPVGAVVGLTLAALGVNAYVSKAAQAEGKTRTRFVLDKLVLWSYQAGYAKEQIYSKIANGISVAADGTIQLSKDVAKIISQFGEWLFTQENTVVPSIGTGETNTTATIGDYSLTTFSASTALQYIPATGLTANNTAFNSLGIKSTRDVGIIGTTNGFVVVCLSSVSGTGWNYSLSYDDTAVGNGGGTIRSNYYGTYISYQNTLTFNSGIEMFSGSNADFIEYLRQHSLSVSQETTPAHDEVFTGTPDAWAENKDLLNPAGDSSVTLNPDLINAIIDSLAEGQQATISIIEYLKALENAWDHALDDVQSALATIIDTLTGIEEQVAVTSEAVKNPTITNPEVNPEVTPILDPSVVDPESVVPGFTFPLDEIFPFCIPFDVVAALELFDVPAEAPSLHVHWELPYNIVFDFDLDLSPYDDIAALLRVMETLLFAVGLAVATRSLYIRS